MNIHFFNKTLLVASLFTMTSVNVLAQIDPDGGDDEPPAAPIDNYVIWLMLLAMILGILIYNANLKKLRIENLEESKNHSKSSS